MIKIQKIYSSDQILCGLEIKGHANYEEYGKDIVCAAVSSIITGGFNAFKKDEIDKINLEEGYAKVILKEGAQDSKVVLNTILIQLETIEESYPKNIKIK